MKPENDQQIAAVGAANSGRTRSTVTASLRPVTATNSAVADIVRGQIDHIYARDSNQQAAPAAPAVSQVAPNQLTDTSVQIPQVQSAATHRLNTSPPAPQAASGDQLELSPYQRTMANQVNHQPTSEDWRQYHSAWQKYYQMYYERQTILQQYTFAQQPAAENDETARANKEQVQSIEQQQAMSELRNSIREKVMKSAKQVRKSRHFIPALAGLLVLVIFVGLQFNRQIVGTVFAYTTPGNIEPQNIIVDSTVQENIGPEPKIIIPKINIDAPVIYGVGPDYNSQMAAMEKGIAHFSIPGANAVPVSVIVGCSQRCQRSATTTIAPVMAIR